MSLTSVGRVRKSQLKKWTEKKLLALEVSDKLHAAGMKGRAVRMSVCSDILEVEKCSDCGDIIIKRANLCRDRLCPICSWRLSLRRYADMMAVFDHLAPSIEKQGWEVALATCTVKNASLPHLRETIDLMAQAYRRMKGRKAWIDNVIGAARSLEVTYNEKTHTAHPHYHILLIIKKGTNVRKFEEILHKVWDSCARLDYISQFDLRLAYSNIGRTSVQAAALEAFKYAVKSKDTMKVPVNEVYQWANGIAGRRLIGYYGVITKARQALGMSEEDQPPEEDITGDIVLRCRGCGGTFSSAVARWSGINGGYEIFMKSNA